MRGCETDVGTKVDSDYTIDLETLLEMQASERPLWPTVVEEAFAMEARFHTNVLLLAYTHIPRCSAANDVVTLVYQTTTTEKQAPGVGPLTQTRIAVYADGQQKTSICHGWEHDA